MQFDDSIVCMGSEGEWRMTSYAGSECSLRVGYIHVLALVQANSTLSAEVNTCLAPMKETCPAETD